MVTAVKVSVKPHSDIHGNGLFVVVSLRSRVRPTLWSNAERVIRTHQPFEEMRTIVGVAAGTLAEYQDDKYGDQHDPSECQEAALEAFDKMIADYNQHGELQEAVVVG